MVLQSKYVINNFLIHNFLEKLKYTGPGHFSVFKNIVLLVK
jgi:hypothetical protein